MLKRVLLLILITLSFILTGCGDDPKSLVRSGIDDKSGVKISEVYNKKKGDEQTKFAKEITVAYFEQAKVDMSKEFKPDFHHYKLDDSLGDLLSRIDSGDSNFKNLRKLHQLFQRRRTDGDKILALHRQLGLGSNRGDLRYDNAGPIDEYTLYIFHTVPFSDLQPVYAAIGYQVIGNEYVGRHVMPDVNNYLAMVHVPKNGSFFTQGQGVYTFYAAQAGEVKFKDAAGFERNLPLLQLVPDGQVGAVRQFINLHKTRVEMQDILIPQFINNVLAEPGGEFQTGVAFIDRQKPNSVQNPLPSNANSAATVNTNQSIKVKRASATSHLKESNQSYPASQAVDGDVKTCWVEGASGNGINEGIYLEFDNVYELKGFNIWTGYQKSEDLFYKNSRPIILRVRSEGGGGGGYNELHEIKDSMGMQRIDLKRPIKARTIGFTIIKVAPGSKYEDTCISEVSLF